MQWQNLGLFLMSRSRKQEYGRCIGTEFVRLSSLVPWYEIEASAIGEYLKNLCVLNSFEQSIKSTVQFRPCWIIKVTMFTKHLL